jgi:cytidylate kinase
VSEDKGKDVVKKRLIVTIDGPAGAGKSTVSRLIADALSYIYLDTGALYRAVAYKVYREGLVEGTEEQIGDLCRRTDVNLKSDQSRVQVYVDGCDVTDDIRDPRISMLASRISALPIVRERLLAVQREMAENGGIIAEGRDMGTVVFPHADIKFFLDASVEERARRRYDELRGRGLDADPEEVREEIVLRDLQDRTRDIAPLRAAPDAIIIDSSNHGVRDVAGRMLTLIRRRYGDAF